ncbi:hypothetical protein CCR75_002788 [Bremia lactucae]|uniref:BZIP domain-containing protein n=1 Tax=Bremia lactucae TaxID=4779 RepID=A0A976FQV4_BRELC|nr:hypothetical protein CCR75_002788 [Bremia lactucae]
MQVAIPEYSSIHGPDGVLAPVLWSSDDQEILDILLLTGADGLNDVDIHEVQQDSHSSSHVTAHTHQKCANDMPKGKNLALERRVRHREVVKRAYHRNKAALNGLRETVNELEKQLEQLSLSRRQMNTLASKRESIDSIQRRYVLLRREQEELSYEATRICLLLKNRQRFATTVETLAQRAAFMSSNDLDCSSTNSDEATTSSATSLFVTSPSSPPVSSNKLHGIDCDVSPLKAMKKTKTSFSIESPTFLGPPTTEKSPLMMLMRKQLGYKPLSSSESSSLVNDIYRSILSFALCGTAISSGASIMGWEDKRLLDGTGLKFSLRKNFVNQNALQLMMRTWQCLSDPECIEAKFRGLISLRILQCVNDDTIVALRESRSEDDTTIYRCVHLLFRVRTRQGFFICVQSLAPENLTDPALSCSSRDGRIVQWTELSGWFRFDPVDDGLARDQLSFQERAQVEYGGYVDHGDVKSVATLAMNTLSIVFKWESMMIGPIFSLSSYSW